jgi:histidine ammonia-lyase
LAALDFMAIALAELGSISEEELTIDFRTRNLPVFLDNPD